MTPMQPKMLLEWMLDEKRRKNSLFGVNKIYTAQAEKTLGLFGANIETPIGPAAGPHTQLTQNILAAYAGGARFFELKTVQVIDGEDLPVAKPCIVAEDECYNVEWSTELTVPQALDEYVKAWFLAKIAAQEYGLGRPDAFLFNMSVGYDLEGIKTEKVDSYIEGMKNASALPIWKELKDAAYTYLPQFGRVNKHFIDGITPVVSNSVTESTLHGCPPQEIESIANYLMEEKGLNTFIKVNPTLLGYQKARDILDKLGFDYIEFDDTHFREDLQFEDAVPMITRLMKKAEEKGLTFGVKVTNTFPVDIAHGELPGKEMYMSGRSLFPLSITVAKMLNDSFGGKLRISFSGGSDAFNIGELYAAGIWPVTVATTLLKAGGYNRMKQMADHIATRPYPIWGGIKSDELDIIQQKATSGAENTKSVKPLPSRKIDKKVPLLDCFIAPCKAGCPIKQDVTAYVGLAGQAKYEDALRVIIDKNPLPAITGTICNHRCMDKCVRNFYEQSVLIRDTKLLCTNMALDTLLEHLNTPNKHGEPVAVIGAGAAGMAAAFFLARAGVPVTLFEKENELGGIVRYYIPEFRIPGSSIDRDVSLLKKMGVDIKTNTAAPSIDELKKQGFKNIVLAIGAYKQGTIRLEGDSPMPGLEFLKNSKAGKLESLGENVVVIGGGNTAMDAARAAKRAPGVKNVAIVYRRTKRWMPADEEELELAIDDGVEFKDLLAPQKYENGVLTCTVMELGEPDASGRRSPVATDKTIEVAANTVITAVGDKVDDSLLKEMGITVDSTGKAVVDQYLQTSIPGVFIAGDAHKGPATVVEAIADARVIADYITKARDAHKYPYDDGLEREKKGVLIYNDEADTEAVRCLECGIICENCVDVCPNRANISVNVHGKLQILHIDALCNECGNCETFCPYASAPYKDKFTLFLTPEDFANSTNEGFYVRLDNQYQIRLDGIEFVTDGSSLPDGIDALIKVACANLKYFL